MAYLGKTRPLVGKFLARKQLVQIQKDVDLRRKAGKRAPHLAAIWIGDDKASEIYCFVEKISQNHTEKKIILS